MASKIIVAGDVNGKLEAFFSKVATLHAKNNFSLAIISGNLFAEDDENVTNLLSEKISIPLPTYFTVGTNPLPQRVVDKLSQDEDLCPNLHYLGKRSTTKTSEGIRIVTLGGLLDTSIVGGTSKEQFLPFHTVDDAKVLRGANTADILLTTAWPASIRNGSKVPVPESAIEPTSYQHISDLCAALKPRYHFSSSATFFFEREPFLHPPPSDTPDTQIITRFISLAPHGNPAKQKALYAFSLQHSADYTVSSLPYGTTPSPFTISPTNGAKKRPAGDAAPYSRFSSDDTNHHRHNKRGRKNDRGPPPGPGECFFCLSNPNLATHLVASIGDDAYLTTAKGPLTTSTTNASLGLPFPAHILIIPLTHSPTLALIDDASRANTFAEMKRYKAALQAMVAKQSNARLGAVTYEVSRGGGVHTHWQFLPVPVELIRKGLVEAAFRVEAENLSYPAFKVKDVGLGQGQGDFFRVWIWSPASSSVAGVPSRKNGNGDADADDSDAEESSEAAQKASSSGNPTTNSNEDDEESGTTKSLLLPLSSDFRFDLQFGRRVLAKLLGLEKRLQWRDCAQSEEEEKTDVEAFKGAFGEWDFTLDGA